MQSTVKLAHNEYMSLDRILELGQKLYLEKFKEKLEKEFLGSYAVVDVEKEKYVIAESKLQAFDLARKTFGDGKLFFGVHIGELDTSTANFTEKENASLSWAV